MRKWIALIQRTEGALRDAQEHLDSLADAEDKLSKADSLEHLHYQRGKVDGIRAVVFALTRTQ